MQSTLIYGHARWERRYVLYAQSNTAIETSNGLGYSFAEFCTRRYTDTERFFFWSDLIIYQRWTGL